MKQLQPEIKQKEEEYDELDQIAHDVSSILSLPPRGPPFVIPNKDNGLRACLICGLLKTPEKWNSDKNCENCGPWPTKQINQSTTHKYQEIISIIDPRSSWFRKILQIGKSAIVPGAYGILKK